jgi:hypothetical protein
MLVKNGIRSETWQKQTKDGKLMIPMLRAVTLPYKHLRDYMTIQWTCTKEVLFKPLLYENTATRDLGLGEAFSTFQGNKCPHPTYVLDYLRVKLQTSNLVQSLI